MHADQVNETSKNPTTGESTSTTTVTTTTTAETTVESITNSSLAVAISNESQLPKESQSSAKSSSDSTLSNDSVDVTSKSVESLSSHQIVEEIQSPPEPSDESVEVVKESAEELEKSKTDDEKKGRTTVQPANITVAEVAKEETLEEEDEYEEDDGRVDWWDFDDAAYLARGALKPGDDAWATHNFNQAASDKLKPDRSIPDTRHAKCRVQHKTDGLPSTSVVIVYHNEAHSTLLRTVVSVLQRTPTQLIKGTQLQINTFLATS